MASISGDWDPAAAGLVQALSLTARGPKREGVFALWLVVRVAGDLTLDPPLAERAHRRRLTALEQRLTSLTFPPPLRRALGTAIAQLRDAAAESMPAILTQLVAPARDTLGPEAAEAVALAVRGAKERLRKA